MRRALAIAAAVLTLAPASAAAQGVTADPLGETPATGYGVFRFPQAVAYTPGASTIVVGDQYSGVVQRFSRSGVWEADIGSYADDRETGRIGTVGGVATDRDGHLFVLDSENDRVQVFRIADGTWLAAWGSNGTAAGRFRLGANTGAGGIAIDQPAAGAPATVYVADQYNHRVQAFALTQSASGAMVLPPGPRSGDVVDAPTADRVWGSFGTCTTCLQYPQGVAVDTVPDAAGRRHVFVADDRNHRVVEFLPDGTYVRQVGTYGIGNGQFRFPYDVGIDSRSPRQMYVADNNNHRVQAFDVPTLAFAGAWGQFGSAVGTLAYVRAIAAVADDPAGGYAVTDTANNRIQTYDAAGQRTAVWGIAGRGPGYVTAPRGVAIDATGRVHVADTVDDRIERLAPDGAYLGQTAYVSANSTFAAPGTGAGQFDQPRGIAFSPLTGRLWVADTANHRVQELTADGAFVSAAGSVGAGVGQFSSPGAVAAGADGAVYVADTANDRVQRRDPASGAWSVLDLGGETLAAPAGVTVAPDGAVLVADTGHDRVLHVAAGTATALPAPPGGFHAPTGLAARGVDVYVADTGASRVLRRSAATWSELGGEGTALGRFIAPTGLALDTAGHILVVADTGNDRLQRITLSGTPPPLPARVDVSVAGSGGGTVTSAPEGISCPTDCRQGFTRGATVTLTATPDPGSRFEGWTGACSGTGPCALTIGDPAQVGAAFAGGPPPAPPAVAPRPPSGPPPARSGQPAVSRRDRTAPSLRIVRLSPTRLRPRATGGAVSTRTRRGAGGATLTVTLSERATLTFRVARARPGRRAGRRCLARGRGRRCTRWVLLRPAARLTLPRGTHRLTLSGRLAGHPLHAGRHHLLITASDGANNRSAPRTVTFTVRARGRA